MKGAAVQELTGAIRKGGQAQYLDKLQVERERGITVKVRLTSCAKHMQASALFTLELVVNCIESFVHKVLTEGRVWSCFSSLFFS